MLKNIYSVLFISLGLAACGDVNDSVKTNAAKQQPVQKTAEQSVAKQPNVIVILSDDQGYADMSIHNNPDIVTKNLDALANSSVRLNNHHVDPTCSPTRAALMTGRYSTKVGVWLTFGGRNHLYREETTMAEVFKHNGYNTAIIGKWHLGDNYPFRPNDRGFDYSLIHGGGVAGEAPDYWENDYFDDTYFENGKPLKTKGYSTDVWFNHATKYIKTHKDKPFFMYLATNTPHGPFNVLKKYMQPYIDAGISDQRARFYGMIQTIDENVGELRSTLDELGIAENTIIIYMTDNGTTAGFVGPSNGYPEEGFNANMRGRKTSAYEGGHRAAGFFSWPKAGYNDGRIVNELTAHFDLLPTFVDLLSLDLPSDLTFDGVSLKPLLDNQKNEVLKNRTLVVHNQSKFGQPLGKGMPIKYKDYSVMTQRWRLVGNKSKSELFDLAADPSQKINVVSEYPDVAKQLSAYYENWWQEVTEKARYSPTVINPTQQAEYLLTGQAWHGDKVPYDQQHVRSGYGGSGFWDIDVELPGKYQIELRRWPKESNLAFADKYDFDKNAPGLDSNFKLYSLESKVIDVNKAQLTINRQSVEKSVKGTDKAVTFNVDLKEGFQKISAEFTDKDGEHYGAYYLYLTAL